MEINKKFLQTRKAPSSYTHGTRLSFVPWPFFFHFLWIAGGSHGLQNKEKFMFLVGHLKIHSAKCIIHYTTSRLGAPCIKGIPYVELFIFLNFHVWSKSWMKFLESMKFGNSRGKQKKLKMKFQSLTARFILLFRLRCYEMST